MDGRARRICHSVLRAVRGAERKLVFPELAPHTSAAAAGLPQAQEVVVPTSDGEYLVVEGRSRSPAGRRWHRTAGALYRGYEGATGSPSETGRHLDADAACAFAVARVPADRIVVWGHSLGTGVAECSVRIAHAALQFSKQFT